MKENKKTSSHNLTLLGWRPVYVGLIVGVLFLVMSFLPSLLPRPWWIQGFISGLSMAVGYGFGLAFAATYRWFFDNEPRESLKKPAWRALKIILMPLIVLSLVLGLIWQNEVRDLIGVEPIGFGQSLLIVVATAVFFWLFMSISRLIRKLSTKINARLNNRTPRKVAILLTVIITIIFVNIVVSGVFMRSFYTVADSIFGARDDTAPDGIVQPQSKFRSGSPESVIPWEEIGFQGRGFVGGGPTAQAISDYSGVDSKEPIRVYAGLASADSAEERARLAVAELNRTEAFEREVLVIATPTGTGWLDPTIVDSLEFIHNGDTAIVSQQYSYLPSWISFLVDQERAREAGRVLYDTVIEEWIKQPEESRPKLIVYGLSLGSFGGQTAFSGVNDMRRSVDGALFAGTPNDTEVWRRITSSRDEGTPEWQPVIDGGRSVRFASTIDDMTRNQETWDDETRVLFLQHANDPVVWFSFDLLFNEPDWLTEPRGRAVSTSTRWFPIVTFLHIGLDQVIAGSAPIGEGHYYIDTGVYAWAAVLPPEDWDDTDSRKLQDYINQGDYQTTSSSL
jgi:uncharacterized membrane protein